MTLNIENHIAKPRSRLEKLLHRRASEILSNRMQDGQVSMVDQETYIVCLGTKLIREPGKPDKIIYLGAATATIVQEKTF